MEGYQLKKTRWRGATYGADIVDLFNTGANLARFQIVTHPTNPVLFDCGMYASWVGQVLEDFISNILPHGSDTNKFVLDIHTPPGGYDAQNKFRMFSDAPWAIDCLVDTWKLIAQRFKDEPRVLVYDLCNEPAGSMFQVEHLMRRIVAGVREIDKHKKLSVSGAYGSPAAMKKIAYFNGDRNIWYTCHCYQPLTFSHQGIAGRPTPVNFKGTISTLKDYLKEPIMLKQRTDSQIYIGEFSACVDAPQKDRIQFISDYISIFEEYGFNWSWHAWHESKAWDCDNTQIFFNFMKSKWAKNQ